jgi:valyl-tRNA synthetase
MSSLIEMMMIKMTCQNGKHKLTEVLRKVRLDYTEEVVNWCTNCGAIVVDIEVDGRLSPGGHTKMQFPSIVEDYNEMVLYNRRKI